MLRMNPWAIVAAAVAAFVFSSVYYGVLGQEVVKLHADPVAAAETLKPAPWKVLVELARSLLVAYVLARFVALLAISDWKSALGLAVWMWIGFSLVLWVGSIMWENVPVKLAAIHAGDWLLKTVLIAVILAVWRK